MIFAIVGPSASGKSTIERKLGNKRVPSDRIQRIISYTTRPPREMEENGVDYHFVSEKEFTELLSLGFFTEHAQYREWNYGLSLSGIDYENRDFVVVVTPKGYEELVEAVGERWIRSIFINVDERERMLRLVKRGDEVDEIIRRIHTDRDDFAGFKSEANFIIQNEDVDKAVDMAYTIIRCLNK
jgi:guanylate kinase